MKKIILLIISILVLLGLIKVVIPLIKGNLETEKLTPHTRAQLGKKFILLSNGTTHYELKGKNNEKTIVLIHGNAAPYVSWDKTIDALVDAGYRVLRYDLFGHGFSDRPRLTKYNKELYDKQLDELLHKLEINTPVYLVGTSQGGSIAAHYAANHKGKVSKLALLSPLFDSFQGTKRVEKLKRPILGEYLLWKVGDENLINPSVHFYSNEKQTELITKLIEQIHYKGKKRAILANLRGNALDDSTPFYLEVKNQSIPVLLTWGKQDLIIPKESMERLRKLIPSIEYHEIDNARHLAHYELADSINPILIDFFKE